MHCPCFNNLQPQRTLFSQEIPGMLYGQACRRALPEKAGVSYNVHAWTEAQLWIAELRFSGNAISLCIPLSNPGMITHVAAKEWLY